MDLIVPIDIRDIYGRPIVDAGESVTQGLLSKVAAKSRFSSTCRLGLDGSRLRRDMEDLLMAGPYLTMLPQDRRAKVLEIYDNLRILPVLFEEFQWMRDADWYLYEHTLKTAALTTFLALDFFGEDKAMLIGYTALTHDIGMSRLPDDILKQDIGDDAFRRYILYSHTIIGHIILTYYIGNSDFSNARVALEHHERPNGSGYPKGIEIRDGVIELLAVSDTFDALISPRPFRPQPMELRAALDFLLDRARKGYFSGEAVKLLIASSRQDHSIAQDLVVSREARSRLLDDHYIDWSMWKQSQPAFCPLMKKV